MIDDEHWSDYWRKKQEWQEAARYLCTEGTHNGHTNNGHNNHNH